MPGASAGTGVPEGNKGGSPPGDRTIVDVQAGTAHFLAERPGGEINYRPKICQGELRGRTAQG